MRATKSEKSPQEDRLAIQQKLQWRLAKNVSVADLVDVIARLLKSFGKRVKVEVVARGLADELAPRFTQKSNELQRLIKYRPKQLSALADSALWDELQREVIPVVMAQKKSRVKITTEEERIRRTKIAKNRYEHIRRSRVTTPGWIERNFAEQSGSFLLDPYHRLPPTGPCLDEIFHGGTVKMYDDIYSLQSLFGLGRKKLSAAGSGIPRGRETFYGYCAVLACMDALLKQTGSGAHWLPAPARRRTVLTGILFRARQEATPKIREAFERTLVPHLN
jgi:hypothetical protein